MGIPSPVLSISASLKAVSSKISGGVLAGSHITMRMRTSAVAVSMYFIILFQRDLNGCGQSSERRIGILLVEPAARDACEELGVGQSARTRAGRSSSRRPWMLRVTEARKSGTGEPSADEESEAEVDQTVVFPNVSQMNSCVRRSLLLSAIRLLKLPSAMRARLSLPSLAARSLTVCMAAVTRMPASSPFVEELDHGTVDDVGGLVHEERDGLHVGTRFASVVSLAGIGREVGEDDGAERAATVESGSASRPR